MPLIAFILANLPTIITAGEAGYRFVHEVRTAAIQKGEWTEADEVTFNAKLTAEAADPAWKPDAPVTGPAAAAVAESPASASEVKPLLANGPTLDEYVAAGYKAENYPPSGYAVNLVSSQVAAPEVASADLKCPVCGNALIADHPDNCNCNPA